MAKPADALRCASLRSFHFRRQVQSAAEEMHQLFRRGHTPKARPGKFCGACSLKELCLPQLIRRESVSDYLNRAMEETP